MILENGRKNKYRIIKNANEHRKNTERKWLNLKAYTTDEVIETVVLLLNPEDLSRIYEMVQERELPEETTAADYIKNLLEVDLYS